MSILARRLSRAQTNISAPSTPGSYAGLQLWLKADAIVGVSDGGSVGSWADASGQDNNASNATAGHQPKLMTGETNGLPVVRFDGIDDALTSAASCSYPQQTIFAVIKPSSISSLAGIRTSSDSGGLQLRLVNGMPQLMSQGIAEAGIVYDTVSTTEFQVLVATYSDNGTYSFWLNKTVLGSGTTSTTLNSGRTSVVGSSGSEDYFPGDIAELACYSRVLSDGEITNLVDGLMRKWIGSAPAKNVPGSMNNVAISYTAGETTARLFYETPSSDGGSAITGYRLARNDGGGAESGPWSTVVSASTLYYDFTSLKPGNTYTLTVSAINAVGDGSATSLNVAVTTSGGGGGSIAAAVISDSFGTGDDVPRGVPDGYSWKYDADTDPAHASMGFKNYGALNTWCQVFVVQSGSPNYNVRVQTRDPRLYFFDGSSWTLAAIPSGSPYPMNGAYFAGNFQSSTSATSRNDGSNTYSTSLQILSGGTWDVFHFWWDGMFPRISIPSNAQGVLVRTDLRLIPENGYSGVPSTSFIASTCADEFATPNTATGPGGMNPGIPEARMKYVTGDWQHFYATTLSVAQTNANPPPA